MIFTKDDVVENSHFANFEGQWLIIRPESLSADYRDAKYQLWNCKGDFLGADTLEGRKIFGVFAADFDCSIIYAREDIIGIAKPETVEAWKTNFPELAGNVEKIHFRFYRFFL